MKKERTRAVLIDCLRRHRAMLILVTGGIVADLTVFLLYDLPIEPFLYASVLILVSALFYLIFSLLRSFVKAEEREKMIRLVDAELIPLPSPDYLVEADYQKMLVLLRAQIEELNSRSLREKTDMQDYYTAWVHQIKTPIAVMRMLLQEETESKPALEGELFRIEAYVEMVLAYIRLEARTNDLDIRQYALDDLLRQSIRKYASQFILKKLKLDFQPTERTIITDGKWFCTVVEQLLSNAIKYTPSGGVTVRMERNDLLISDTGIGIAPEDMPRIFEKGYTGINGRLGVKSSGIGLYLCKKAADKLVLKLSAHSTPGKGSTFVITLHEPEQ